MEKKSPLEELKDLQVKAGELEIKKSKLLEQIHQVNLDQQKVTTRLNELVLEAQKGQKMGSLFVPETKGINFGDGKGGNIVN